MSIDHVGDEPLKSRPGPRPTCRNLCRFLFKRPGHTNRRHASLSAVMAGAQQNNKGNGQGSVRTVSFTAGGKSTASRHGAHLTSTSSLIRQCQQICSPNRALMVTGWNIGEY